MPAKDIFHEAVRKGLGKEGWVITDDPLKLQVGGVEMYVDLGAEKIIAAEKDGKKINALRRGKSGYNMMEQRLE